MRSRLCGGDHRHRHRRSRGDVDNTATHLDETLTGNSGVGSGGFSFNELKDSLNEVIVGNELFGGQRINKFGYSPSGLAEEVDLTPVYVYGLRGEERRRIASEEDDRDLRLDLIESRPMPDLYWCQIVPPDRAAEVGTERFRWAPAPRTEQLRDGAVLLVTHHTMLTRDPAHAYWGGSNRRSSRIWVLHRDGRHADCEGPSGAAAPHPRPVCRSVSRAATATAGAVSPNIFAGRLGLQRPLSYASGSQIQQESCVRV